MALITDIWCPWARDYRLIYSVKTDTGHFWDSLAPVSCLFNLLLSGVVEALGKRCRNVWQSTDNYNKNLVNLNAKGAELCLKRVN